MSGRTHSRRLSLLVVSASLATGCANVTGPLELTTADPAVDQRQIARYHSREAASLRVTAQQLAERIAVYENLFGPESDWVRGTRLLEQFYESAAQEQDQLANAHLNIAAGERPLSIGQRDASIRNGHTK